jgi:hypothetical protein
MVDYSLVVMCALCSVIVHGTPIDNGLEEGAVVTEIVPGGTGKRRAHARHPVCSVQRRCARKLA